MLLCKSFKCALAIKNVIYDVGQQVSIFVMKEMFTHLLISHEFPMRQYKMGEDWEFDLLSVIIS